MWYVNPNVIRTTSHIRPYDIDSDVLIGTGSDSGKVVYRAYLGAYKWVVVEKAAQPYPWDCTISFKGDTLKPYGSPIHGKEAWVGAVYCIYARYTHWVVRSKAYLGMLTLPLSSEAWWRVAMPGSPTSSTYSAMGAASGSEAASISAWPHWESDTLTGVYTAFGVATGTQTVGIPNWKYDGVNYTKSLLPVSGHYTYFPAVYDAILDRYTIGTEGSETGWWVGDEPTVGSSRTFVFTKLEGSGATGSNITLNWDGYILGDNISELTSGGALQDRQVYLGEAAIWRV